MSHAAALLLLAAGPAADCPLAREPYSSRSPLADLLGDASAVSALMQAAPELAIEAGDMPGGITRIVTPALLLRDRPGGAGIVRRLDAALAGVKLTEEAVRARCARYDRTPPRLPRLIRRPAILLFGKVNGFDHGPALPAAAEAVRAMAARRGWTVVASDNGAVFNPRGLARFDAVVWNNVSGDVLTISQRAAFRRWIERGGGYAGVHGSGGDPVWFWDWYADGLLGARFTGHPMTPQFQAARVRVEGADGVARGLPREWTMTDEWYSFARSPRGPGTRVVATLDEGTYRPSGHGEKELRMGDHPIAWTRCVGDGRSFYSAIGHRPESYREPNNARLLEQGIAWAMGLGDTRCRDGREIAKGEG